MAKVFVSYARNSEPVARRLTRLLGAAGHDAWSDAELPPHRPYAEVIEERLASADAVVVLWSADAARSQWVRAEAEYARERGKLLQASLDGVLPPLPFNQTQCASLPKGDVERHAAAWSKILASIDQLGQSPATPPPVTAAASRSPRARRLGWSLAGVVLILLAGGGAFLHFARAGAAVGQGRVAILPFEATNDTPIAHATARALTAQLGDTLNSNEIPTISDEDAATLRGTGAGDRLKALRVSLLFAGSVEADDKTVEIKVHLDDPVNHLTLWTGGISGPTANMGALRALIANTGANLLACSNRALKPGGLTDPALLSHYLTACDLFANHDDATGAAHTFELIRNLHAVIAGAPEFVPAHTDLAKFSAYLAPTMPPTAAAAMRAEAAREAEVALKLQPASPDAYLAKAMLLAPDQWAAREALLRKGVSIDPEWPHTNGFLAQLLQETGRMREAEDFGGRAAAAQLQIDWRPWGGAYACDAGDLEPATGTMRALSASQPEGFAGLALTKCLTDAGHYKEVLAALSSLPGDSGVLQSAQTLAFKARATGLAADREAARQAALKIGQGDMLQLDTAIAVFSIIGDVDDAFGVADRIAAGYPRSGTTTAFLFTPPLEPLQRDPRFMRLAARLKLVQFWRASGKWPDFCAKPGWPYDCRAEAERALIGVA